MKKLLLICALLTPGVTMNGVEVWPQIRVYKQINNTETQIDGTVSSDKRPGNLFTVTYKVDYKKKIIVRTKVHRQNSTNPVPDETTYEIVGFLTVTINSETEGVLVAIGRPGYGAYEYLQMGESYLHYTRNSFDGTVISGAFERIK